MHSQYQPTPTERFLKNGWFYTNNSEQITEILMELKDKNINIKGSMAGDWKYCIISE